MELVTTGTVTETTEHDGSVTIQRRGRTLMFDPVVGLVLATGNFSYR